MAIQAVQIRMNLQQLFKLDEKTARRFLDRWNSWVQVCDLAPMKRKRCFAPTFISGLGSASLIS
jgi:hypothetical protein